MSHCDLEWYIFIPTTSKDGNDIAGCCLPYTDPKQVGGWVLHLFCSTSLGGGILSYG